MWSKLIYDIEQDFNETYVQGLDWYLNLNLDSSKVTLNDKKMFIASIYANLNPFYFESGSTEKLLTYNDFDGDVTGDTMWNLGAYSGATYYSGNTMVIKSGETFGALYTYPTEELNIGDIYNVTIKFNSNSEPMLIYSFDSNSGIYAPTGSSITQYQITKTTSQDNIRFFIGYDLVNGNYDTIIDWIKIYKGEQKALMDDIYPQSEFFTFSGNTIDIFLPSGITRFATPGELGIALTLKDVDNKYDTYNVRIGEIVKNWDAKEYNKFEF